MLLWLVHLVYEQNNIVRKWESLDDWTAELAVIACNEMLLKVHSYAVQVRFVLSKELL